MIEDKEPVLVRLILFPFRLILFLVDLTWRLCLLMLSAGLLAILGLLLWSLIFHQPQYGSPHSRPVEATIA